MPTRASRPSWKSASRPGPTNEGRHAMNPAISPTPRIVARRVGPGQRLFDELEYAAVKQWKAAAPGRKAIGYMPVYVPRELVHAAGMLPGGILGGGGEAGGMAGAAHYAS